MNLPFLNRMRQRQTRRRVSEAARRYEAVSGGRRRDTRQTFGRHSVEAQVAAPMLRSRARFVYENNAYARNAVDNYVAALVGAGIRANSAHPNPTIRQTVGDAFDRWATTADADVLTDWWGLQANVARAVIVDGESFLIRTYDDGGRLRWRQLPPEMVNEAETRDLANGSRTVSGIEFDAAGNRTAYHVFRDLPADPFATTYETVRVPADDVIHVYRPTGPGQVRGVSWLAPVMVRLNELDGIEDALAVGVKVSAMFAGFLTDMNGTAADFPFEGLTNGSLMESGLEPGVLQILPGGYDIKFATPQQAQQTAEFLSHEIRAVAAGLGVPTHLVDGDLRQANYSSLRAGLVTFRQRVEAIQFQTLVPQFLRPVWEKAVTSLVYRGEIIAPDFEGNRAAYLAAEFYPPALPWVDPQKDVQAVREAIDMGLMSRRQAVAERGYSVEAVDAEIAADRDREQAMGLSFTQGGTVADG